MIVSNFTVLEIFESGGEQTFQSHELRRKIASFEARLNPVTCGLVGVCMERSTDLICVVVVLLEKRVPFIFLKDRAEAALVSARWVFDGSQLIELPCAGTNPVHEDSELCYFIRTSGTTGDAKLIGVPYSCIEPNIDDFRDRFAITSNDTILFSTSLSFDPSIVEMFLAFTCGARLLLVPDSARSQPYILARIIKEHTPTFVQFTPSVLSLIDEGTLSWMLGGETFPLSLVRRYRTKLNPTRVFNVYGVTEVSCWASVAEVTPSCTEVGIGSPLKYTTFAVNDEMELLIGGSRRCLINDVPSGEFTSTGDVVERKGDQYFFVGRTDDQVKVNGIRCSLSSMSEKVSALEGVSFSHFLLYKQKFLVLFVLSSSSVKELLRMVLPSNLLPSKVIYLETVPVNSSGKVDKSRLIELLENECSTQRKSYGAFLAYLRKFSIHSTTDIHFHSFVDYGNSYSAEIALMFGDVEALHDILSPDIPIVDVLQKYVPSKLSQESSDGVPMCAFKEVQVTTRNQPIIKWACDTGKCIDGTPLFLTSSEGDIVVVASHSGFVACIRVHDGTAVWQTRLPCRFEASPECCGELIAIGGYNGCVYFLSINTGTFEWSFTTDDVVKAACAGDEFGFCYVPSYDGNLYKLNPKLKTCCWSTPIGSGSPARVTLWNKIVLVTTIRGNVEAIGMEDGVMQWICSGNVPIFSSMTIHSGMGYVSSVDGTVTKIRLKDGKKKGTVLLKEVIFASVLIRDDQRMGAFDKTQFDTETSQNFDATEIASKTSRYEKEAAELVKDKAQVKKVIGYIDLTTLAGDDTKARVVALTDRALAPVPGDSSITCAAVCVYPQRVHDVSQHLNEIKKKLNIAAVAAGFPSGQYHLKSKLLEVELTVADGATEIDIVISRAAALEGDWKTVHDEVAALKSACGKAHMKTILATGELKTLSNVYKASWASMLAGSNFIKTSTGKETVNATLEVAFVMCSAIKKFHEKTGKKIGFKPAGGIKTPQEALAFIALIKDVLGEEWLNPNLFRIGASSLLDNCLKAL
ncbi:hypothetical protein Q1695_011160 [Nippostrongylus brasiliensis]|nr:hypothetical protein Q1695_011160 [Nippostrongylus brasiliensis]